MTHTLQPEIPADEDYGQVFRPDRNYGILLAFRPLEYLAEWEDGFGKTQPAVISEVAVLERVKRERPHLDSGGELVPVEDAKARTVTVKHVYLVEALRPVAGRSIVAGRVERIKSPWVLMPPEIHAYHDVVAHCQKLGWV
ncbi:hypothetical protein ACIG3E_11245 [Streptomyces sp. NPDC053474]|uniref:hypothetical protein n=1 Tax=Streptomyces sp. NPDC053474 TaxID=3365704 RepID=UPI0037CF7E1A